MIKSWEKLRAPQLQHEQAPRREFLPGKENKNGSYWVCSICALVALELTRVSWMAEWLFWVNLFLPGCPDKLMLPQILPFSASPLCPQILPLFPAGWPHGTWSLSGTTRAVHLLPNARTITPSKMTQVFGSLGAEEMWRDSFGSPKCTEKLISRNSSVFVMRHPNQMIHTHKLF